MLKRFVVEKRGMTCGSAEAEAREYTMAIDKNQRVIWLYSLTDSDPGGHVYCHDTQDVNSDGFAGRTISFKIGKTAMYQAKGPWHANSDALYSNTGIDLRDKHLTFVVIAKRRGMLSGYRDCFEDILYMDDKPMLGSFHRGRDMAIKFATEFGYPVACYSESGGGSSSGYELPEGTKYSDWTEWFKARVVEVQNDISSIGSGDAA